MVSRVLPAALAFVASSEADLPALNIDPTSVTTSGISSGAFFAVQVHIAYSGLVRGAGIVAGGPYHCATSVAKGIAICMDTGAIDDDKKIQYMQDQAAKGTIDSLDNLKNHSVVLWSGTKDKEVTQKTMKHLETEYQMLGVPDVVELFNFSAGHGWPSDSYGVPCGAQKKPWINNCGYDFSGELFSKWYGPDLEPRVDSSAATNLKSFAQTGIYHAKSMTNKGFVYVPESCAAGKQCRLHINFHGCKQGEGHLGDTYASHTGLNEWAESNDIVVLYPQAASSELLPLNPQGCWDWWGYNEAAFATKEGSQMKAVKAMVDQLMSGHTTLV